MTILVADDDPLVRKLLTHFLESFGFDVIACEDGVEALQILEEMRVALLVLDYEMPELNGTQVCERIRRSENLDVAGIPIILLTAHSGDEHEVESLGAGANDFVTKPVNLAVLKARIDAHAGLYAMRQQLKDQNDELEKWRYDRELDLEAARLTQQAIVPQRAPALAGWEFAARFRPLIQVGGDMYDWLRLADGGVLVWIADATGHGVSAALFTTLAKLLFRHASSELSSPAEIMEQVNTEFFAIFKGRSFMTAACVALRGGSGRVTFSGAGHPPLLVVRGSGVVESIASRAPPLGLDPTCKMSETECVLENEDALLLYTDGLYGTSDAAGERLSQSDMTGLAAPPARPAHSGESAKNFLAAVVERIATRSNGNGFSDDAAAIAALRTGR